MSSFRIVRGVRWEVGCGGAWLCGCVCCVWLCVCRCVRVLVSECFCGAID